MARSKTFGLIFTATVLFAATGCGGSGAKESNDVAAPTATSPPSITSSSAVPTTTAPPTRVPSTTPAIPTLVEAPTTSVAAPTTTVVVAPTTVAVPTSFPTCTNDPYIYNANPDPGYQQSAEIMQRRLKELGYDPGKIDGYIGPDSLDALRAWTKDNGITWRQWDYAGYTIEADVMDALGIRCDRVENSCGLPVVPGGPVEYSDIAKRVQQRLRDLGYAPGDVDGYFGPNSQDALLQWAKDGDKRVYFWPDDVDEGYSVTDKGFDELGLTC